MKPRYRLMKQLLPFTLIVNSFKKHESIHKFV